MTSLSMREIPGPTDWAPADWDTGEWLIELSPDRLEHVLAARRHVFDDHAGVLPPDTLDFLDRLRGTVTERLRRGPGFVVVRGWPVGRSEADEMAFMEFVGRSMGRLLPQPGDGASVIIISDAATDSSGEDRSQPLHTDSSSAKHGERPDGPPQVDILALFCLRPAPVGGESLLASSHAIHNRVLARDPDTLQRLYGDYWWSGRKDSSAEHAPCVTAPVFRHDGDRVITRFNPAWMRLGCELRDGEVSADCERAISAFLDTAAADSLTFELPMEPGDLLLLDNNIVLHGRNTFVDSPEPSNRRCIIRLWLELDD
jgi:alpha-ketoglutarate-dependent taurine dioxygenase